MRELAIGTSRIELVHGDITEQDTDAIVNAANSSLLGGGGVDGAIHRAGGPAILTECKRLGGCQTGDAKITTAGNLQAKHVIHTVGPIYRGGGQGEAERLGSAYRRSLEVAVEHGLSTISFPSISTGAYGYPIEPAARIALQTVADTLAASPQITTARFVLFSAGDLATYEKALSAMAARF
jgi:O-acetyl-ADP-ribose deacetylase (regulator of RNase III)